MSEIDVFNMTADDLMIPQNRHELIRRIREQRGMTDANMKPIPAAKVANLAEAIGISKPKVVDSTFKRRI